LTNLDWKKEFIYEISRRNNQYIIRILNSKTYEVESTTTLPENIDIETRPINGRLINGNPVYVGMCLMGSSAEISQIRVWKTTRPTLIWNYLDEDNQNNTPPEFKMPLTEPAYVPATNLSMTTTPAAVPSDATDTKGRPMKHILIGYATAGSNSNGIDLMPVLEPAFANATIGFEWFTIEAHPAMTLVGAGEELAPGVWQRGRIRMDPALITVGEHDAIFLAVTRDPTLDTPEIKESPDYSLLQTLTEYYFRVRIRRTS